MNAVLQLVVLSVVQAIALQNIPGIPGTDYPIHAQVPRTRFSCQQEGYFADVEARCQVFHVCQRDGRMSSFLCPNGTVFHQPFSVCVWWYDVQCSSPSQRQANEDTRQPTQRRGSRDETMSDPDENLLSTKKDFSFKTDKVKLLEIMPPDIKPSDRTRENFLQDLNDDDYEDDEPGEIMIAQSREYFSPLKFHHRIMQQYSNSVIRSSRKSFTPDIASGKFSNSVFNRNSKRNVPDASPKFSRNKLFRKNANKRGSS